MKNENSTKERNKGRKGHKIGKIMKCLGSGEHKKTSHRMVPSSESLATRDYHTNSTATSSRVTEFEKKLDTGNVEEAELSLRESGSLNYEEARALLGRYEYQKGNIEAALHVFEGIDIAAVTPKMKISLAKRGEPRKRRSHNYDSPPMSIHAVSLLLEAIFLKAKTLEILGRYKEAAQSCTIILDIVESSLPGGLPENFATDSKLQETLYKTVELLPELWKLSDSPSEAILSYRRALLHNWNIDQKTTAKIQKEFAIFLLYSGGEASPPNLRSQMDSSFVPRNNIEEAILLLMIFLRKTFLKIIQWDPSVLDHLSYALSISGGLGALANQLEELLPGVIERKDRYLTLALCYYEQGDNLTALNLLKNIFCVEDPNDGSALLLASKICVENPNHVVEGVTFARRATKALELRCDKLVGLANFLLGISLSEQSRMSLTESDRVNRQLEALQSLENGEKLTRMTNSKIVYHLSLENAEQRKLDIALEYAKYFLKLEGGLSINGWLLLARILSAQKKFSDAENIINAALDETGKWDQGPLLRTKAKLQIVQGQVKNAIATYTQLLAVIQVQKKSFGSGKKMNGGANHIRDMEQGVWHDLANVYINLSQWRDAEVCLSKSKVIDYYSASGWHTTGLLQEAKGLQKEALNSFSCALDVDPTHVPSLVSTAKLLKLQGHPSHAIVRSYLTEALKLDRMNSSAWYNLGLLYKDSGPNSAMEASDCFEAAILLMETEPIEPFGWHSSSQVGIGVSRKREFVIY